ncbi:MAG: regulatory protein RecX [Flavobacteriales bacterium]
MMRSKKIYTETQALQKMQRFCIFQERSQEEVRRKLYELGFSGLAAENIIVALINDKFINEERFVKAYISGKFNILHWGKLKIRQGLKKHQIPEKMISKLLNSEIDADDYESTIVKELQKLYQQSELNMKTKFQLIQKLYQKGFEPEQTEIIIYKIFNLKS